MRIVANGEGKLFIITPDNDICTFVGQSPMREKAARETSTDQRATIAQSVFAVCAGLAGSLQRAARW